MQLCQIHFYQKIARKKVARVNAALGRVKVSFRDRINHIHKLNVTPTLIITSNQSINQSITFIYAQINIIRFQNTAQKNKAPGDGENDRPVFESTTTCHKSCSVKVCFEKVQLHK